MLAKFPTAPEIFQAATPFSLHIKTLHVAFHFAIPSRQLRPKVRWLPHGTPSVRAIIMVYLCSRALSASDIGKVFQGRRRIDVVGLLMTR